MDLDTTVLDPALEQPFRLRLRIGDTTPADAPRRLSDLVVALRQRGAAVQQRAEWVAGVVERLSAAGWRLVGDEVADGARETVSGGGFAARGAAPLPPSVVLARDARPGEVAGDLIAALGEGKQEIPEAASVRLDGYELPVRIEGETVALVYSLRTYLDTFSIRG